MELINAKPYNSPSLPSLKDNLFNVAFILLKYLFFWLKRTHNCGVLLLISMRKLFSMQITFE
jgi:hypothetical protein